MPDKQPPHIDHTVKGERMYEEDHIPGRVDCLDRVDAKVHTKGEADAFATFLRGRGYKVKVIRVSYTYVEDDVFFGEEDDGTPDASAE